MLLGQLIFRLDYYGEWVPNTALIKLTPSLALCFGRLRLRVIGVTILFAIKFLCYSCVGFEKRIQVAIG